MTSEGQTPRAPRAPAGEIGLLEQDLRRELERGRVVVVVGAGVAVAATRGEAVASWVGLLENGVSRCEQVFLNLPDGWGNGLRARIRSAEVDDLLSVADEVTRVLGGPQSGEYRRWLRETVGRLEPRDPATIEALHDLDIPIVTTNYDSLIERVTGLEPVTWRGGPRIERLLRGDEPGVLHLHGHWEDPESVVLGIRSYEEVLGDAYAQFVPRALSAFNSLLFVGVGEGLKDPNFEALRRWLGEVFAGSEYRHFRLVLGGEARAVAAEHESRERIFVVPYGDRHEDLAPFLRGLRPQPPPPERPARGFPRFQWSKRRVVAAAGVVALLVLGAVLGITLSRDGAKPPKEVAVEEPVTEQIARSKEIAIGKRVTEQIAPRNANVYTFVAKEGQRIYPDNQGNAIDDNCDLDDLTWSLQQKGSGQIFFEEEMSSCSSPGEYDLPEGTYELTVFSDADATVSYRFAVLDATPDRATISIGGKPVTGQIAPHVTDVYTFTAEEEQRIYLDNQELAGSCDGVEDLFWRLEPEEGTDNVFDEETMKGCRDPLPQGYTLPRGTYLLTIYDYGARGRYKFALTDAAGR